MPRKKARIIQGLRRMGRVDLPTAAMVAQMIRGSSTRTATMASSCGGTGLGWSSRGRMSRPAETRKRTVTRPQATIPQRPHQESMVL